MARTGRPKVTWVQVPCAGCAAPVERRETDLQRQKTGRVFCSKVCRDRVGCKPRRKQDVTCEACARVFYPSTGSLNRFCSKKCHDTWQARNAVWRTCEVCAKEFRLSRSTVAAQAGRWCSKPCEGQAKWRRVQGRELNGKPVLMTSAGYLKVWVPSHPNGRSGWILEHRLVAEQVLGRYLETHEHVHHKNRDKTDNRPENLEVMSASEHSSRTGYERALRERQERERLNAELEEYKRRFGPL